VEPASASLEPAADGRPPKPKVPAAPKRLTRLSFIFSAVAVVLLIVPYIGFFAGIVLSIFGAILGGVAERQIRQGHPGNMTAAKAGRILGIVVSLVLSVLFTLMLSGFILFSTPPGQQIIIEDAPAAID
jgi:hypothetical protein